MKNTSSKNWIYDSEMTKIPMIYKAINKREQLKKLQYVFVLFKHCETKNYAVKYLKDHVEFGSKIIYSLSYNKRKNHQKTNKNIDDTKFLGHRLNVGTLFEPDELNWDNLPITDGMRLTRKLATISVAFLVFVLGVFL